MFRILLLALCAFTLNVWANNVPTASPEEVGMSLARLRAADEVILRAIRDKKTPGAVLAVVRHGKLAYLKAYGNRQITCQSSKTGMAKVKTVQQYALKTCLRIPRDCLLMPR